MGGTWFTRRLAEAVRGARRLHAVGIHPQQRVHLAAFLIAVALVLPARAEDITFNPATTDAEFATFSRIVAQAIFPTPVQPARSTGLLGFDIGVAASAIKVDTGASYWKHAVSSDFTTSGYVIVPRLVVSKGLSVATVSGSYAKLSDSGVKTIGGTIDLPVIRGSLAFPEIALRGSYATVSGSSSYEAKVYGVEAFISKGFGPVTPYAAVGRMRTDAKGTIHVITILPVRTLSHKGDIDRFTIGARLSLLVPKLAVEVTKAEVTSYAAKVSFGF